ncbi:C2 calcium-dependent membrane targeting [Macleaya cordata]|uniref:C2 calcium-dependent membrane targeting n=1 Tax=Macleaya cordata TaxID=56857 RepID=A0A200Q3F0_MACCD|nr:C2 calcium-dependent membrane targeting [Macleaya cordata]
MLLINLITAAGLALETLKTSKTKERIELQEFSLGSTPPNLGLHGTRWSTSGDQQIMRMGFEWDTNSINIMLLAKLAKPLVGTARIVINSIHIKGDLLFMPILDGQAVLYSFESTPEVRIGVVFGSGSQTLPATELPGVSSWLVKLFTDTLVKTMVEPRRRCYSLPPVDLNKKAVGGIISVTVVSASTRAMDRLKGSSSGRQESSIRNGTLEGNPGGGVLQTFVEVELGELTRKTNASLGSSPRWDATFNMVLHEDNGILKFNLYEWVPNNLKHDYITSSELKVRYVKDDSTTFWAVGPGSSVLAKRVESVGQEVEMVIPFEGNNLGELTVRVVLREWQFSDGSRSFNNSSLIGSQRSMYRSSDVQPRTGRKLKLTVVEGRDLVGKDKLGKSNSYVKLQYGKALYRTRTVNVLNPVWNEKFEFDEIGGGEYLKVKCYSEDTFTDDSIGSAQVNLEGLVEGQLKDIWVPLEKVSTGELRLQIEAVKNDDYEESRSGRSGRGWIELVVIEGKDLIAADLRGTSDPYVRVHYGNLKKRTKVTYKTLNPQWNQTLEFPDDGSPLELHVKDHNAVLPTSSIGHCVVEYQRLPPNQMADKWIPLQGVRKGEIHVQITRKVPELQKRSSTGSNLSSLSKANQISDQMRQIMTKFRGLIEDEDLEGLSLVLNEMEISQEEQEEYMVQLENEQTLLLNKIGELGQEIFKSSPSPSRKISG